MLLVGSMSRHTSMGGSLGRVCTCHYLLSYFTVRGFAKPRVERPRHPCIYRNADAGIHTHGAGFDEPLVCLGAMAARDVLKGHGLPGGQAYELLVHVLYHPWLGGDGEGIVEREPTNSLILQVVCAQRLGLVCLE